MAESNHDVPFDALARSGLLWSRASYQLTLSADTLWEHAVAGQRILDETTWEGHEPPAHIRALEPHELQAAQGCVVGRVALMLLGLAIETTAKTILIEADPESVVVNDVFAYKSHDLIGLLSDANVPLSAEEQHHVRTLQDYVEWYGRYPVPVRAKRSAIPDAFQRFDAKDTSQTWQVGRAILKRALSKQNASFHAVPNVKF